MSTEAEDDIQIGELADDEDLFYCDWALETYKANIAVLTESLRQLTMVTATLLGASVVFLNEKAMPPLFQGIFLLCLSVSMVAAFLGMLPREQIVHVECPPAIRAAKESTRKTKYAYLCTAAVSFLVAIGFGVAGMVAHWLGY